MKKNKKSNADVEKRNKNNNLREIILCILAIVFLIVIIITIRIIFARKELKRQEIENAVIQQSQELKITNSVTEEYVKETNDGTKINTNPKLNTAKELDGLQITNIQLTSSNGITTLLADVTNNSNSATDLKEVLVEFLDKDGKELTTVNGVIMPLEKGASTKFNTSVSADYITAYDIEFFNSK